MNWNLIIEDDAGKTIVVPLARDQITIGRKEGNTIRLTERNVSRFHAKLVRENGHVFIEDLKSYNGIKVNGDKIAGKIPINEGDLIEIGDYHLALQAQDAVEPALAGSAPPQKQQKPSALEAPTQTADDDEFAGDTQRWEAPASMDPLPVASPGRGANLPTQEEGFALGLSSSEATMPVPPAREQPTLDERMPLSAHAAPPMDTAKLLKADGMAPPHGWPAPTQGAPAFANLATHGQNAPPPPGRDGRAAEGALFTTNLQAEETLRTTSAPSRASAGGGQGAVDDIPTASPFDVVGEDDLAPPAPTQRPVSQPAVRALEAKTIEATMPMPAPQPKPAMKPAGSGPVAKQQDEQTEQLRAAPVPADADLLAHKLVVLNTVFAGSTFPVRAPEMIVGRTEDNDITIEHRSVSRNHAKLVREGERMRIVDLKSANGVLVNGEEVDSSLLRPGDVIELGRVRLRYVPPGEKFVVPPDEIERARVADTAGDDFADEPGTHITSPLRAQAVRPPVGADVKSKAPLIAAVAGTVVIVVVVALLLMKGGDESAPPPAPSSPRATAPEPPKPEPPKVEALPTPTPAVPPVDDAKPALPAMEVAPIAPPTPDPPDPNEARGKEARARMDEAIAAGDAKGAVAAFESMPKEWSGYAIAKKDVDGVKKVAGDEALKAVDAALKARDFDRARAAATEAKLFAPKARTAGLDKQIAAAEKAAAAAEAKKEAAEKAAEKKKRDAAEAEAVAAMPPGEAQTKARELVREATQSFMGGDLSRSLTLLKEARTLAPRLAEVHRNLGVVYARLGEKEAAYKSYKTFLDLQPDGDEAAKVRTIVEQYEAAKGGK